jgi:hypothetical protein
MERRASRTSGQRSVSCELRVLSPHVSLRRVSTSEGLVARAEANGRLGKSKLCLTASDPSENAAQGSSPLKCRLDTPARGRDRDAILYASTCRSSTCWPRLTAPYRSRRSRSWRGASGAECRSLAGPCASASIRAAHGVHQVRDRRCRRPAELAGTAAAGEPDRRAMAMRPRKRGRSGRGSPETDQWAASRSAFKIRYLLAIGAESPPIC